jgi:hypothetical protein
MLSQSTRISLTLILAGGLALFVWGALYSWGISVDIGSTYLGKEPPYQVQASVRFAHFVFYVCVLGALSQIAGLIFVWRRTDKPAAPDSAIDTDTNLPPI